MQGSRQEFGETGFGDHIILIYEDAFDLTAFAVPFFKDGLAKGERCVYVVDDLEPGEVIEALSAGGVQVTREIERGALVLTDAREHFALPPFDASRVVELIRGRVIEARSSGFAGLRIAAGMTWTLEIPVLDHVVVEFESLLAKAIGPGRLTVACMYRRDRFDAAVLRQLVRHHTKVVADDSVYLSLNSLFQDLARTDLRRLAQSARERHTLRGGFYFHQGDEGADVYMLTRGLLKLVRTDPDGRSVILRIVEPMDSFGDPSLGGTTRLASAQALEDSRALVWDSPTILQAMMAHPAVSLNAARLLEERVEKEWSRLHELATSNVARRLARLLLRLARSIGHKMVRGDAIEVSLSGQDLAETVIASPYTISRILAEWRRLDILDAQRQRILILDPKRLAAIAGEGASEAVTRTRGRRSGPGASA